MSDGFEGAVVVVAPAAAEGASFVGVVVELDGFEGVAPGILSGLAADICSLYGGKPLMARTTRNARQST